MCHLVGDPQLPTEGIAGTSRPPRDLLVSGKGYKNLIFKELLDDPMLSLDNMRYFQKISKEMYKFTLVSHAPICCTCLFELFQFAQSSLPSRIWPNTHRRNQTNSEKSRVASRSSMRRRNI